MTSPKRRFIMPLIACFLALGALSRSPGIASIRTVDALLILAAGFSGGVAFGLFLASRGSDTSHS